MSDLERDLRDMMQRTAGDLRYTPSPTPGLIGRARVRRARTTLFAGGAVLALVVGGFAAARSLSSDQAIPPAHSPPEGIFADVGGWIAYGDRGGIWAVDPTQPGDRDKVQLSSEPGLPRAWSPDGSKLLVLRNMPDGDPSGVYERDLFILNADGTETRVTDARGWVTGGAFSPDGGEVVYAVGGYGGPSSISVVDADGGTPQVLRTPGRIPGLGRMELYGATFSPDGTHIAYFEGMGDHSNSLRVMNADGSGDRLLLEDLTGRSAHLEELKWSPDGSHLAFSKPGIWVVGADGTGLTEVVPYVSAENGSDLHWSPDGSRISYNSTFGFLEIARWDGTQVQDLGLHRSGPWNPAGR